MAETSELSLNEQIAQMMEQLTTLTRKLSTGSTPLTADESLLSCLKSKRGGKES